MEELIKKAQEFLKPENLKELAADPEKREYLIMAAAGIIMALLVVFAIIPAVRSFSEKGREIERIEHDIDFAHRNVSRTPRLKEQFEQLKREYEEYASQVPGRKEIGDFLESLAITAGMSGVRLLSVTPLDQIRTGGDKKWERYTQMMVVISAKGGYDQLKRFVKHLEKGRGFSTVRDMRIQHDPRAPLRHDADIVIRIYMSPGDA